MLTKTLSFSEIELALSRKLHEHYIVTWGLLSYGFSQTLCDYIKECAGVSLKIQLR